MFIDRKINGALIQDLAQKGLAGGVGGCSASVKDGGRATNRGKRIGEEGKD